MRRPTPFPRSWPALACLLASCAGSGPPPPPPAAHANGQVLWKIVHDQCVPSQLSCGDPAPCAVVSMPDGAARGFAILKDRNGVAQYLLMPTAKITGIEDPAILEPGATNYFAKAWVDRDLIEKRLGRPLARTRISIAVNSAYGRTQDQLHLHMDCLDPAVGAALKAAAIPRTGRWASHIIRLRGHPYRVRWLKAQALETANPFTLLAGEMAGARRAMGAWTIALIGAAGDDGAPGFYILADRFDPATHDDASAEELQDHACKPEPDETAPPDSARRGP